MFDLDYNFHYQTKTDSVILLKDDKRIKWNKSNLQRITLSHDFITTKIIEINIENLSVMF